MESYNEIQSYLDRRYDDAMDMDWYLKNWERADKLRSLVAEMINAQAGEIFYDFNSSSALNVLSSGIDWESGANIVSTSLAFPATTLTWLNQSRRGLEVRLAPAENGMVPLKRLAALVDDRTIAISLCFVENTYGFRHNLYEVGQFCRKRGLLLAVDATQGIGAMQIDVQSMQVDFLVASSYKWLGNMFGIGFGYVSARLLERITPRYFGWVGTPNRMNSPKDQVYYHPDARRFELGGLNWAGLWGMEAAIKNYLSLGKADVESYILGLTEYLYQRVTTVPGVGVVGPFPQDNRSGITYLTFPASWELTDRVLAAHGVRVHVASPTSMRVGVHFYNNRADIDRLVEVLSFFSKGGPTPCSSVKRNQQYDEQVPG